MSQMTICFWAKLEADDDNRREDWLVSIARQGLCGQIFGTLFRHVVFYLMLANYL